MSFSSNVSQSRSHAISALRTLNRYDHRQDPRSDFNNRVLNDARRQIDRPAIRSAYRALDSARWSNVSYRQTDDVYRAVGELKDATWDLTSYSKWGGRDTPDVHAARHRIQRSVDLLDSARYDRGGYYRGGRGGYHGGDYGRPPYGGGYHDRPYVGARYDGDRVGLDVTLSTI